MDEIRKARKLREEILQRAASIKESMLSVNQSMANMNMMENKAPKAEEPPATRMLDLPADCLRQVLYVLGRQGDHMAMCCLAKTCKTLLQLVNTDGPSWEVLCRKHWKVRELDPHLAPRMDTCLLEGLPGFSSSRYPAASVQEAPGRGRSVAGASQAKAPEAQDPKSTHRASDPVGASASFLSSTASGSARQAALALRQEQQQQQHAARSSASKQRASPSTSSMHSEGVGAGSAASSPATSPGDAWGGRSSSRRLPPWDAEVGEGAWSPEGVSGGGAPDTQTSVPLRGGSSSGGRMDGVLGAKGHDVLQAAPSSPVASLARFGSIGIAASSRAAGDQSNLHLRPSLQHSLSLANGWHGSSSMSSSRRATYGGEMLLGRSTGIMLAAGANVWRQLCKDRVQGWRLVMEMLAWLQQHKHPPNVSGATHRLQQLVALRYLALFTQHPDDVKWRQSMIKLDCLKSLLALCDNENGAVVEMSLHCLSNHVLGDQQMKFAVNIGSRLGKSFLSKLDADEKHPSIVREASRLLATLWAEDPCPEVFILTPVNTQARPTLSPGMWYIQEFSSRGESLRLLEIQLTFEEQFGSRSIEVHGSGHEPHAAYAEDTFRITGSVDSLTGAWSMQRRLRQVPTVLYEGYSDREGAWGVYRCDRREGGWLEGQNFLGRAQQPRVFRLFRKQDSLDDYDY